MRIPTTRASTKRKVLKILDPHAGKVVLGPMDTREKIRRLAGLDGGHGAGGRSTKEFKRIGGVAEALGECARDGDLAPPIDSVRRELGDVLASAFRKTDPDDMALRSSLLRDLWVLAQPDFRHVPSGFAHYLTETFRDRTTEAERVAVSEWFKRGLQKADNKGASGEVLHAIGHWMLEYVGSALSDGEFEELCRETGQFVELAGRMLDQGKPEEALEAAKQASPKSLKPLCFAFYDRGELGVLAQSDALPDPEDPRILPEAYLHVALMHLDQGYLEGALPWVRAVAQDDPDAEVLIELREVAERGGVYSERLEDELIEDSEEQRPEVILDFHLEFDELADAFHLWEQVDLWSDPHWHDAGASLLEAARDADELDLVITVATAQADDLIERRGRNNYRAACSQLAAAKKAVEASDVLLGWDELFSEYEDRLEKLPALRDEAQQAGLTT